MNLKISLQGSHGQSPIFKEMTTQSDIVERQKRALKNKFWER